MTEIVIDKNTKLDEEQLKKIFKTRDAFSFTHFGKRLFRSQQRFSNKLIESVVNNEGWTLAAEFSRQSGKTESLVISVLYIAMFYSVIVKKFNLPNTGFFNIGIFAPQYQQSKTDFDRIKRYLKDLMEQGYGFKVSEANGNSLLLETPGHIPIQIYCFSASSTSNTESKTLNLIILEEAQKLLDDVIDNTIAPMGMHTRATKLYIGTAGYKRCRFWEMLETLPEDFKVVSPVDVTIKERDEMFKKTGDTIYQNYQKSIDKELRELNLSEDSDAYKVQYKLIWVLGKGQFIEYKKLIDLETEYEVFDTYGRAYELYGGIDWGKQYDSTVFTVIDADGRIIMWKEISGVDYASQVEEIYDIINNKYNGSLRKIWCDSTGNQDMGVSMLRQRCKGLPVQIIGYNMSSQGKDFMFKSLHSLLHPVIFKGEVIEEPKLKIPKKQSPEKERFIRQMMDFQVEVKGDIWKCHHPEGAGYHDDFCDSLALACLGITKMKERRKSSSGRFAIR